MHIASAQMAPTSLNFPVTAELPGLWKLMTWMAASAGLGLEDKERDPLNLEPGQPPDGLDNLDAPPLNLRFGKDLRLVEVSLHSCFLVETALRSSCCSAVALSS